ncbi:MAG: hypothetical protein IKD37_08250 [Clostridia bacterium]|nr:hypothetical protein [Clostridia bacterium]
MKASVQAMAAAMKGINDLALKGEIVVFGSTYMAGFPLYELVNRCRLESAVYNRSIAGLTLDDAVEIVQTCVIELRPSKLFLALGEEDEADPDAIKKYAALVAHIRAKLPACRLYLICLPGESSYAARFNQHIQTLCDGCKVSSIEFVSPPLPESALAKVRFKQLSSFFRSKPLKMPDAFALAEL